MLALQNSARVPIALIGLMIVLASGCATQSTLGPLNQKLHERMLSDSRTDRSITKLLREIEKNPESAELRVVLGQRFLAQGSLNSARLAAQAAIELAPANADAWRLIGDVDASDQRFADALTHYQNGLGLAPNRTDLQMRIANSYLHLDRPLRAASTLENLVNRPDQPASVELLTLYGNVMQEIGQHTRATQAFSVACQDPGATSEHFIRLSHSQVLAGDVPASAATLQACLQRFPESGQARELLDQVIGQQESNLAVR